MDMDKDMCMGMGMGMEMLVMSPATGSEAAATTVVATASEDEGDLRRGPWTVEEDMLLVDYIAKHGEGRWNSLARFTGLRRTGKSCRLRWLNYLRPDVRRGNITPEEQLLILELHSRWGNRWSKIAQHLPGRTDNEIKNYWRTRVQKHARQLKCDVNSNQFRDVVRFVWMPRLLERMHAASAATGDVTTATRTAMSSPPGGARCYDDVATTDVDRAEPRRVVDHASSSQAARMVATATMSPDTTSTLRSSSSMGACFTPWGAATGATTNDVDGTVTQCAGGEGRATGDDHVTHDDELSGSWSELLATTGLPDFEFGEFDNLWSLEDVYLQHQC